ncbi:MAG: hypothetical protein L3J10_08130 [Sulfurimonas sp.]|nr:hypothetical protein [Sulfurimonas sp.]
MENMAEFIFITMFMVVDFVKSFMPNIDIVSGIILFVLSLCIVCLMMRIIEKEIILKGMLLFTLTFVFYAIIKRVEIINEVTVYISSLVVGILLLLTMAAFTSWDDDSEEFIN